MRIPLTAFMFMCVLVCGARAGRGVLGVSYPDVRAYADAPSQLDRFAREGFRLVCFVPTWAYVGLDQVDRASGPPAGALGAAIDGAFGRGLAVVVKPHLDPPIYKGLDLMASDNHSWRAGCGWRGFFDVDPMCADYCDGVIGASLDALARALAAHPGATARLDLGSELMNSLVEKPERWLALLGHARRVLARRGLVGRVTLSHNVSHHFLIPQDEVLRMRPAGRRALARYVRGLDALAVSQYMDLTVAVPAAERGKRPPAPREVAAALLAHERTLRGEILARLLGIPAAAQPELHLGEFGIGRGGLRHPNLWQGDVSPDERARLQQEAAIGMRGLGEYLAGGPPRTAKTAILWTTGRFFDIFGWFDPKDAVPPAVEAVRAIIAAETRSPSAPRASGPARPGSRR